MAKISKTIIILPNLRLRPLKLVTERDIDEISEINYLISTHPKKGFMFVSSAKVSSTGKCHLPKYVVGRGVRMLKHVWKSQDFKLDKLKYWKLFSNALNI